jgi:hypothetical protein
MSTKTNANLNAVELTQAELDSVTGGMTIQQAVRQAVRASVIQAVRDLASDARGASKGP